MHPIGEAWRQIIVQKDYYAIPPIDKLSDFDKGVHKGRFEGLTIAHVLFVEGISEYKKGKENG